MALNCLTQCCQWMTRRQRSFLRTHWVKAQLFSTLVSLRPLVGYPLVPPPRFSKKKQKNPSDAGGVLLGCSLAVLVVCVFCFGCFVFHCFCPKCEKSVSTFYCPSLSQTSTVGKVSSVKLFHKLSKNTASRKPTKTSSLQARNYQTTSAVSKTLPGFQNSKQNSKSTSKVQSTSAILYFWINSVHGKQKAFKT